MTTGYRVAKNRRKARTHRPEKITPVLVDEPTILCKPSYRTMPVSEYAAIYYKELAAREAHWQQRNGASPYHPRLGL